MTSTHSIDIEFFKHELKELSENLVSMTNEELRNKFRILYNKVSYSDDELALIIRKEYEEEDHLIPCIKLYRSLTGASLKIAVEETKKNTTHQVVELQRRNDMSYGANVLKNLLDKFKNMDSKTYNSLYSTLKK